MGRDSRAGDVVLIFKASRLRAVPFVVFGGAIVYVVFSDSHHPASRMGAVLSAICVVGPVLQLLTLRLSIKGDQLIRWSASARDSVTLTEETQVWIDDVAPMGPELSLVRVRAGEREVAWSPLLFKERVHLELLEAVAGRTAPDREVQRRTRPVPPRRGKSPPAP